MPGAREGGSHALAECVFPAEVALRFKVFRSFYLLHADSNPSPKDVAYVCMARGMFRGEI